MIFSRQIAFWGEDFQQKLTQATVFVAGIGGIGCLLSEILVRAGIGKIYLCDQGVVDPPDLNRQLFYTEQDIGKRKIDVAVSHLRKIHGQSQIRGIGDDVLSPQLTIPKDVDIVADCLDNFGTRFAFWHKISSGTPYVHGGVEQFFGQVLTLVVGQPPSLETVFGNCDTGQRTIPVTGATAATVGSIAANEVIANIFGKPQLLRKILVVDLSDYSFEKIAL